MKHDGNAGNRNTIWVLLWIAMFVSMVSVADAANLKPGDILVIERTNPGGRVVETVGAVVSIDPATGDKQIVSSGNYLIDPTGIAVSTAGDIYIINDNFLDLQGGFGTTDDALIRIDPSTGTQTVVSKGGLLANPRALAIDLNGDLLVATFQGYPNPCNSGNGTCLLRINPVNGAQTMYDPSALSYPSALLYFGIGDMAIEPSGTLVVTDSAMASTVHRIDLSTGADLASCMNPVSSEFFGLITVDASGNIMVSDNHNSETLYQTSLMRLNAVPAYHPPGSTCDLSTIFATDPMVSCPSDLRMYPLWGGLAVGAGGKIFICDIDTCNPEGPYLGRVFQVDPGTGDATMVTSDLYNCYGMAINTADVTSQYLITVTGAGVNGGTMVSGSIINATWNGSATGGDNAELVNQGSGPYTITATANTGITVAWSGDCDLTSGNGAGLATCTINVGISAPKNVTATFSAGGNTCPGTTINSGETKIGNTITGPSYTNTWTSCGNAGDRVIVNAVTTSGTLNSCIILYPPDGGPAEASTCGACTPIGWSGGEDILDHQLQQTGLYTIVIEDAGPGCLSKSGTYNVSFLKILGAVNSPEDPDGGAIASGETKNGTINVPSDMDAFQFYGASGDRTIINAVTTSGTLNTCIILYPPDRGPAEASTCGACTPFGWSGGGDIIDHQLQQTGLYTIVIEDAGPGCLSKSGTYNIALTNITSPILPLGIYNPSPANGVIISNLSGSLSWGPVAGATGYDVWFKDDVTLPATKICNNVFSPSCPFPPMDAGKTNYWEIVAHTPSGDITGPVWWFQFSSASVRRIQSGTPVGSYSAIQAAYSECISGDIIEILAATLAENPNFNSNLQVLLKGGYNLTFGYQVGFTTVHGTLTISVGRITVENLIID